MNYSSSSSSSLPLFFFLSLSSLLLLLLLSPSSTSQPLPTPEPSSSPPSGTIARISKQQLLTSIPPHSPSPSPQLFLTSPSGKYSAFLLRSRTSPAAPGGFGNDFCYVQIQDTETSTPLWESECTPVTTANSCSLVFSDEGLAIYDGSNPQWDTGAQSADNNPLESLELVDEGDMRIRDKIGELAWRASEDPRVNQKCGEPGSPGLGSALPPFAQPIGGGSGNLAFGQNGNGGGQGVVQAVNADNGGSSGGGSGGGGSGEGFGFGSEQQPLVDNSPFDSGSGVRGVGMGVWGVVVFVVGWGFRY